ASIDPAKEVRPTGVRFDDYGRTRRAGVIDEEVDAERHEGLRSSWQRSGSIGHRDGIRCRDPAKEICALQSELPQSPEEVGDFPVAGILLVEDVKGSPDDRLYHASIKRLYRRGNLACDGLQLFAGL